MTIPVEIKFRHVDRSEALEANIRERVERLERFHDRIQRCEVTVASPHRHKHKGGIYQIGVQVELPGREVLVSRAGEGTHAHEDVYVAVRDAFSAVTRQLEDYARRRDHRTEVHPGALHGKVVKHFGAEGYGFVETSDGLEVYFHENCVVGGDFQALAVGDEVSLEVVTGESEQGPQASTVRPTSRRRRGAS